MDPSGLVLGVGHGVVEAGDRRVAVVHEGSWMDALRDGAWIYMYITDAAWNLSTLNVLDPTWTVLAVHCYYPSLQVLTLGRGHWLLLSRHPGKPHTAGAIRL